jgi:hypothetical protein
VILDNKGFVSSIQKYTYTFFLKEYLYSKELKQNKMKSALEIKPDISYKSTGKFEETRFEKNHNEIFKNSAEVSVIVAQEIAQLIQAKQAKNKTCVLGLATGSSPIKVYEELVRMHKEEGLSFANVVTFNLDEVMLKRHAILYHQSQKDRVMFQGNDSREFWVRAEDRNKNTAKLYDNLGLAEYEAIEAFKRFEY